MLAPTPKTQRLLESIQLALTFIGVCGVVDASRAHAPALDGAGYYASVPQEPHAAGDRRLSDLARTERKRRESEHEAVRRHLQSIQVIASLTSR